MIEITFCLKSGAEPSPATRRYLEMLKEQITPIVNAALKDIVVFGRLIEPLGWYVERALRDRREKVREEPR